MNKSSIIVLLGLIATSIAQNPIPIPSLNLSKMTGEWYVIFSYPNDSPGDKLTCWTKTFDINGTAITGSEAYYDNGQEYTDGWIGSVGNAGGSVWDISDFQMDWMDIDPTNYNWGLAGNVGFDTCFLVARTPTLDKNIINAHIALAKKEGYSMDPKTIAYPNNSNCKSWLADVAEADW